MMKNSFGFLLTAVLMLLLPASVFAVRAGDLDKTFNAPKGYAMKNFNFIPGGECDDMVVQPDGKIVVSGHGDSTLFLLRFNGDGSLDQSFGTKGVVRYKAEYAAFGSSIALQADGKIVLAGEVGIDDRIYWLAAVRFNINGTIDNSFDTVEMSALEYELYSSNFKVAIHPDGKIMIIAHGRLKNSTVNSHLIKLNTNGTLDKTFGINGVSDCDPATFCSYSVAEFQLDGKIIAVRDKYNGTDYDIQVMRLNIDGSLDKGFGLITYDSGDDDTARSVTVQKDGKVVVGLMNYSENFYGTTYNILMTRFNSDGTLDINFGKNGAARYEAEKYGNIHKTAIQPDGKLIIISDHWNSMNNYEFSAIRLRNNGTIDTSFGNNGYSKYVISNRADVRAIAVQPDGKIVVTAAILDYSPYPRSLMLRYSTNGQLDTSFNNNGKVIYVYKEGALDGALALAVQPDGKTVVLGLSEKISGNSWGYDIKVQRYNTDGSLDNGFGIDGIFTYGNGSYNWPEAVEFQSDEKIIIANAGMDGQLLRLNSDGTLDTSFGANGFVENLIWDIGSITIQSDDKIVVAGSAYDAGKHVIQIKRINADGSSDSNFGTNGLVTYGGFDEEYRANSVAVLPDGKIHLTGSILNTNIGLITYKGIILLKYDGKGNLVKGFGNNGVVKYFTERIDSHQEATFQPDGKIVITSANDESTGIFRFNGNGTIDVNFGTAGNVIAKIGGNAVAVQEDGKIVIAGYYRQDSSFKAAFFRYNSNGAPDTSFGSGGTAISAINSDSSVFAIAFQPDGKIMAAGIVMNNINGSYDTLVARLFSKGSPNPPSSLTAAANFSRGITLTWTDNSDDETGYKIEKKAGSCSSTAEWKQMATTDADTETYTDPLLLPPAQYSYRVRAYNKYGSSTYSNCATAIPSLASR